MSTLVYSLSLVLLGVLLGAMIGLRIARDHSARADAWQTTAKKLGSHAYQIDHDRKYWRQVAHRVTEDLRKERAGRRERGLNAMTAGFKLGLDVAKADDALPAEWLDSLKTDRRIQ